MENIAIQPKNYTKTATQLNISSIKVNLNQTADISYSICTDNRWEYLEAGSYTLTQEEYNNWGNDDQYIINLMCNKLGLTLA